MIAFQVAGYQGRESFIQKKVFPNSPQLLMTSQDWTSPTTLLREYRGGYACINIWAALQNLNALVRQGQLGLCRPSAE